MRLCAAALGYAYCTAASGHTAATIILTAAGTNCSAICMNPLQHTQSLKGADSEKENYQNQSKPRIHDLYDSP